MTKKLYDTLPYDTEFEALVISCDEKEGRYELILDATLFFPEEGGQTPDTGEIRTEEGESVDVLDVQIRGDEIIHTVSGPVPARSRIRGALDWNRRYDNMCNHTGEHIFSGLVHSVFGYDNVGFHLSGHEMTMDYNGMLTDEDVAKLEKEANRLIRTGCIVDAGYPAEEELKTLTYRSKKEIEGAVRIVKITEPGSGRIIDICACCAPHVKDTSEIGLLKVVSRQNYKKGVRLSVVCGERAMALFVKEHSLLQDLAGALTTSVDNIPDRFDRLKEENGRLRGELSQAEYEVLLLTADSIPQEEGTVVMIRESGDMRTMRRAVEKILEGRGGVCMILKKADDGSFEYVLGTPEGGVGDLQKLLAEAFSAKGGGAGSIVQGRIPAGRFTGDEARLRSVLEGSFA